MNLALLNQPDKRTAFQCQLTTWQAVWEYVLAGNARFTLVSKKTGERFTYRVRRAPDKAQDLHSCAVVYFVSLLNGPDNGSDFAYMGVLDEKGFHVTAKSRVGPAAASHKAFQFLLARIAKGGAMCTTMEVWTSGRCGRCGRDLTVPESVARGLGPECAGQMEAA